MNTHTKMNKLAERKTNLNKATAHCTGGTCDLSKVPHTATATHRKYYNLPKPPERATTASELPPSPFSRNVRASIPT
jgi:hypothetical protein